MAIVFFCQSCGSRFEVAERFAGKRGNCKSCGQQMVIPSPNQLASAMALPAVEPSRVAAGAEAPFRLEPVVATGGRSGEPKGAPAPQPTGWIAAINSRVGLAPISEAGLKPVVQRVELDALADNPSSPYYDVIKSKRALPSIAPASGGGRPNYVQAAWRSQLFGVQKVLRFLNEASYLVSIPFLFLIVLGIVSNNRPLAILGGVIAILLNIGRLATGVFNLALGPFREGLTQGILFLIPPFTFFYLAKHWKRLRKSVLRIVEPALTIGLVVAAFALIPALVGDREREGSIVDRLKGSASELEEQAGAKLSSVKSLDLNQLRDQAQAKLNQAEQQVGGRLDGRSPGASQGPGMRGASGPIQP